MQGVRSIAKLLRSCGEVCQCRATWSRATSRIRALLLRMARYCAVRAAAITRPGSSQSRSTPSSASSAAIELYDKDGDGAIAAPSCNAVPGIKKHLNHYDRDGDGDVTRDEIAERLQMFGPATRLAIMGSTYLRDTRWQAARRRDGDVCARSRIWARTSSRPLALRRPIGLTRPIARRRAFCRRPPMADRFTE